MKMRALITTMEKERKRRAMMTEYSSKWHSCSSFFFVLLFLRVEEGLWNFWVAGLWNFTLCVPTSDNVIHEKLKEIILKKYYHFKLFGKFIPTIRLLIADKKNWLEKVKTLYSLLPTTNERRTMSYDVKGPKKKLC